MLSLYDKSLYKLVPITEGHKACHKEIDDKGGKCKCAEVEEDYSSAILGYINGIGRILNAKPASAYRNNEHYRTGYKENVGNHGDDKICKRDAPIKNRYIKRLDLVYQLLQDVVRVI